ncbi:MAG: DUF1444 family protein [Polyangiales bacterium]
MATKKKATKKKASPKKKTAKKKSAPKKAAAARPKKKVASKPKKATKKVASKPKKKAAVAPKKNAPARKKGPAKKKPKRIDAREVFRKEVIAFLRAHEQIEDVESVKDDFALRVKRKDGMTFDVSLRNFFADTREVAPEDRDELLERMFTPLFEVTTAELTWDEARPLLRTVVRPITFIVDGDGKRSVEHVARNFLPYLIETAVVDLPGRMQFLLKHHLESWGVDAATVFDLARSNLAAIAGDDIEPWQPDVPIWTVASGDSLESSRLVVPGWLASFRDRVSGRAIAAIPHRDLILVAGDDDPAVVARLAETAEAEFRAASRSVSPALYVATDDGALVPYLREDSLAPTVARGHVLLAAWEYEEQKERLRQAYDRDGVDVFVASYTVHGTDEGFVSWCSWGEEVDSLLPRTEVVVIGGDGWAFAVRHEDCVRIVGDCWEIAPDLEPIRYRTKRFPDRAVLEQLFAVRHSFYPNPALPS